MVPHPRSPTQTPIANEAASTGVDVRYGWATTTKVESLETDLKHTKQIYGAAYTRLIKKVKKLEKTVKSSKDRRRARIVVSDDEDDLEDPSKQGRKIAKIDQDLGISLVQHDAEIQERYEHDMEFDFDASKEVATAEKDVSTGLICFSTVGPKQLLLRSVVVSTVSPQEILEFLLLLIFTADTLLCAETMDVYQEKCSPKIKIADKLEKKIAEDCQGHYEVTGKISRVGKSYRDTDDELWKLQKKIHDLTWRLYDSCEMHHVYTKEGINIYMLVEKEYLLSRGTLKLMLIAKLLVDQDNEMYRELLRNIFISLKEQEKKFWKTSLEKKTTCGKDLWEKINFKQSDARTSLTKQERECKLYDEFDKFTYKKGETLHEYYLRFTLLLNDMNIYKMPLEQRGNDPIDAIMHMDDILTDCCCPHPGILLDENNHTKDFLQILVNNLPTMMEKWTVQPCSGRQTTYAARNNKKIHTLVQGVATRETTQECSYGQTPQGNAQMHSTEVVKERTTATAITEGTWGFEHTKACFRDEIIPFIKNLKDIFNNFNRYLVEELADVQKVFYQMEQAVEQHRLESRTFEVKMNQVLSENERLLAQAIDKD
ncbi:hypothetical protein Tco_0618221 [Tanacetum coccineum]